MIQSVTTCELPSPCEGLVTQQRPHRAGLTAQPQLSTMRRTGAKSQCWSKSLRKDLSSVSAAGLLE